MSHQQEDRKPDLSNFPRGAIGLRGLPVGRNARLPSIRTPRDLTLGTQPKRTFMPNIPVRREKRVSDIDNSPGQPSSVSSPTFSPNVSAKSERGRGRGRPKAQIIQTEGAVFGEGIAASTPKARQRESVSKSTFSPGKFSSVKKERPDDDMKAMTRDMDLLMRDDFLDDGDDADSFDDSMRPITYPDSEVKEKVKKEVIEKSDAFQNQDFAKEMGFDIEKVAKYIKKEKMDEDYAPKIKPDLSKIPTSDATEILTKRDSPFFLLRFPECVTVQAPDYQQRGHSANDNASSSEEKKNITALSSIPDGRIGVLQILKSGRARIKIGSFYYYLDGKNPLRSKHEVVCIDTDSVPGDMISLGNTEVKLNFVPDIDSLMSQHFLN